MKPIVFAISLIYLLSSKFTLTYSSPPHVHQRSNERVEDSWNSVHYKDGEHHDEFDHEAVLGSRDKAKEFDNMSPEDAKVRLKQLVVSGMDVNSDGYVDKEELVEWVLKSFKNLAVEDGRERLDEEDKDQDGFVSWEEHLKDIFDIEDSDEEENLKDEMMREEKALFKAADLNGDGKLDVDEFSAFNSPEEYEHMHQTLYEQTMDKKDRNKDGFLDFNEYSSDVNGSPPDPKSEHFAVEKDRFKNEYDVDKDGRLDKKEVLKWIIPDNFEIAINEAVHLISTSDDDHDGKLSIQEILDHHDTFVGSEATDFGQQLENLRFQDEL